MASAASVPGVSCKCSDAARAVAVSQTREPVENEDVVTFTATFASGAVGTFSVSRIAYGLPNSLGFEVFCEGGAAAFDLARAAEFTIADGAAPEPVNGYRQVLIGPGHPYITRGLPMDFPSVGHGQNDLFVFQARAFLGQIALCSHQPQFAAQRIALLLQVVPIQMPPPPGSLIFESAVDCGRW